jgi:hypothetical protein
VRDRPAFRFAFSSGEVPGFLREAYALVYLRLRLTAERTQTRVLGLLVVKSSLAAKRVTFEVVDGLSKCALSLMNAFAAKIRHEKYHVPAGGALGCRWAKVDITEAHIIWVDGCFGALREPVMYPSSYPGFDPLRRPLSPFLQLLLSQRLGRRFELSRRCGSISS